MNIMKPNELTKQRN